jgi:hypothetical protein
MLTQSRGSVPQGDETLLKTKDNKRKLRLSIKGGGKAFGRKIRNEAGLLFSPILAIR